MSQDHSEQFEVWDAASHPIEVTVTTDRAHSPNAWTVTLALRTGADSNPAANRGHLEGISLEFTDLLLP